MSYKKSVFIYLHKILTVIILFSFYPLSAHDDYMQYKFERYTKEDGLSSNQVECIFKDSRGFIWVGTRNGLCRFDGYDFKIYTTENTDSSLSGNWILSINEDQNGIIWVGTCQNGVNRFDSEHNIFSSYRNTGFGNRINKISILKDGSIYLCSEYGLVHYNEKDNSFKIFLPQENDSNSINSAQVFDFLETSSGEYYVTTWHNEMQKFDPITEKFFSISYARHPELNIDYKKKIIEDEKGRLWISANQHGLVMYDPSSNQSKIFTSYNSGLSTNILNGDLNIDPEGNIWIATSGDGINILNPSTNKFTYLREDNTNSAGLPSDRIYNIYFDNQNIIWVGTFDEGLALCNPQDIKFSRNLFKQNHLYRLNDYSVLSIFEDSKNRIWIGTDGDGLFMAEENEPWKEYKHSPTINNTISSDVVKSIGEDKFGNILIGTYAGGLNILNPQNGKIKRIYQSPGDEKSINSLSIWNIFSDSKDRIWLGLLGSGVDLYNPDNGTFKNYGPESSNNNKINHPNVIEIFEDSDGDIWFGSEGNGIYILDNQTNNITRIQLNSSKVNLDRLIIKSIYQVRHGEIWIGTEGVGLFALNKRTGDIEHYTKEHGLPDMVVQDIIEDIHGNLWITSGSGLSKFNVNSKKFVNFSKMDGLSGNEFNSNTLIHLEDGRMMAGTKDGCDIFTPTEIILNQNIPRLALVKLSILNREINAGDTINGHVPIKKQIEYADELVLNHRDKIFTIEFVALNYVLPEKCLYKYKLEGFDDDWITIDASRRMATYSNLNPGNYLFMVKSSNNDGKWGNNTITLSIKVLPPFWKTWIFYILIFIVLLSTTYAIYKSRVNIIHSKYIEKQALKDKRIIELENESLESELQKLSLISINRNRLLLDQKNKLLGLSLKAKESVKQGLDKIIEELDYELVGEKNWEHIEPQLDKLYNKFISRLKEMHPDITLPELKIAAYVRMGLSNKEIAEFLHKTVKAVENDRYRLRKKVGLDPNDSLRKYIMDL